MDLDFGSIVLYVKAIDLFGFKFLKITFHGIAKIQHLLGMISRERPSRNLSSTSHGSFGSSWVLIGFKSSPKQAEYEKTVKPDSIRLEIQI